MDPTPGAANVFVEPDGAETDAAVQSDGPVQGDVTAQTDAVIPDALVFNEVWYNGPGTDEGLTVFHRAGLDGKAIGLLYRVLGVFFGEESREARPIRV